jgi:enoyl-CoA hydratase
MSDKFVLVDIHGRVGLVTLNRPAQLNALNDQLMAELAVAIDALEGNGDIGAVVITGTSTAFAAGADIMSMATLNYMDAYKADLVTRNWERVSRCRKPTIAAVSGFALGGGCELAMMCDIIVAADSACFALPEVRIGILPGAGGTQRLPRAIGKAKAMELCLTGRRIDAHEAERAGLVSRVVPADSLLEVALDTAATIASFSSPVVMMVKESINRAYESSLAEGILFERRTFHAAFALHDQKEGMLAFAEKRPPKFVHR